MRKFFAIFLMSLAVAFPDRNLSAEDAPRTFTDKKGRAIEAVLLEVRDQTAVIRMTSDNEVYEFPIGSLILDDQVWIVEWMKRSALVSGGGWASLRVEMRYPMDSVSVIGLSRGGIDSKVSAREHELLIPIGAWVQINTRSDGDPGEIIEHLVQFKGASHWKISEDDRLLLLSRDGGEEKIVGITLPNDDEDRFLRDIDENRLADEISLELSTGNDLDLDELDRLSGKIVAVTADTTYNSNSLSAIADLKPRAVSGYCRIDSLEALEEFGPLEALSLSLSVPTQTVNGVTERQSTDDVRLETLPPVQDLRLSGIPFNDDLGKDLVDKGILRMLEFTRGSTSSSSLSSTPRWDGVEDLADSLQSLNIFSGISFDLEKLNQLSGLRALRLSSSLVAENNLDSFDPSFFENLLSLEVSTSTVSGRDLRNWTQRGDLKKLKRLAAAEMFDTSGMPELEVVRFWSSSSSASRINISHDLGSLKNLRSLHCAHATQSDLEDIAGIAARGSLDRLRLDNGSFDDLSPLTSLSNLKALEVYRHQGGLERIDLSGFPNLRILYAFSLADLEAIDGVATHPRLEALRLFSCESLASLGNAAPNRTLLSLELSRCSSLADISNLDQVSGLKQLVLSNCDQPREPLRLLENNQLNYLRVSDCANLNDRSIQDLR